MGAGMNRRELLLGTAAVVGAAALPKTVVASSGFEALLDEFEEELIGDVGFPSIIMTYVDPKIFKILFSREPP